MWIYGKVEYSADEGEGWNIGGAMVARILAGFSGSNVYACFVFAKQPFNPINLAEYAAIAADGEAHGELTPRYSEITGYLWTDEAGGIGGHDIIAMMMSHDEEYALMVVQEEPIDLIAWSLPEG